VAGANLSAKDATSYHVQPQCLLQEAGHSCQQGKVFLCPMNAPAGLHRFVKDRSELPREDRPKINAVDRLRKIDDGMRKCIGRCVEGGPGYNQKSEGDFTDGEVLGTMVMCNSDQSIQDVLCNVSLRFLGRTRNGYVPLSSCHLPQSPRPACPLQSGAGVFSRFSRRASDLAA
jgi:hypothetical protein